MRGYGCSSGNRTREDGDVTDDLTLTFLLALSTALATLLVLTATATLGRKLAELEYLLEKGANGVRKIQATINIRTHANRVFLGLTFMVVGVMTLVDAPMLWRTWVGRILFVGVLAAYTVSSVLDWVDERAQVKMLLQEESLPNGGMKQ